jgi:hypothetical protein
VAKDVDVVVVAATVAEDAIAVTAVVADIAIDCNLSYI